MRSGHHEIPEKLRSGQAVAEAATEAWRQIHATDFHRRVRDIALHARLQSPDLIAVQEAARFVQRDGNGNVVEEIDHLQILLAALRQTGLSYQVASLVDDAVLELPVLAADGSLTSVTLYDRDAVLVRSNHGIKVSNPQLGTFQYILQPPDFPFEIRRGWASADVSVSGRSFRLVTAHLEDPSPDPASLTPLQMAQAQELVSVGLAGGLPVVFVGDFNTRGNLTPA